VVQGYAKNHENPIRQDSKNGLSSYYGGYEIDPYCSNLTPLDLVFLEEGRMALYRLHILKQLADPKAEAGLLSIWKNVNDSILGMRLDHTIPVYYYSKIFSVIIDWDYWRNKDPVFPEDALIWFTDGSRANSWTGSGIFGLRPNRSFSFQLGKFASFPNSNICHSTMCTRKHKGL